MLSESDVRRRPVQARSRERFDRILSAAASLIGASGIGSLTMTDIADRAGMEITAVYRYFPNKHAVLKELALRTFAHDTETLFSSEFDADASVEQLLAAGVDEFWRRHRAEPFRLHLRAAVRASAELSALDLDESRRNAATLTRMLAQITGRTDIEVLERQALLVVELVDSLMSLASRVPPNEANELISEFAAMVAHRVASPTTNGPPPCGGADDDQESRSVAPG